MNDLATATSPQALTAPLVLVPVGSIEQHGPHLPLDTDTVIAVAVAMAAAAQLPGSWVAPALTYGSSGEHQSFAGTSSIGTEALKHVLVELTRSLCTWADQVVFVNGHGGNLKALQGAVDQLVAEGHRVGFVACATEGVDLHAGRTETSLMLHLRPETVQLDLAEAGNTRPLQEILPAMMADGVSAVSTNGVLGDPAGAAADEGRRMLSMMTMNVVRAARGMCS